MIECVRRSLVIGGDKLEYFIFMSYLRFLETVKGATHAARLLRATAV